MYFVYILKSVNFERLYIGTTNDLTSRLKDHNSGKSIHTKKFKPWQIICYFAFSDEKKAIDFEKYLKTGSGRAFRAKHF